MQQVVVIHGGDAFEKYEDYLDHLKSVDVSLERIRSKGWKDKLQEELGEEFEVIAPRMPNPANARYKEWKIWFEKVTPLLDDEVIFIGHSLGGIFLSKYLSENTFPKKIKATFLVAAPYNTPKKHPYVDFTVTEPLDKFAKQAGIIVLYHSRDDLTVPFENAERYKRDLLTAKLITFTDRGHFNDETFPEIVTDIQKAS